MSELNLTDDNFESEVLQSSVPVLVDFWAPWCGPCQQMSPLVEQLAGEIESSKIKITKMNVDENQKTPGTYQVMSIPTFIIFKNGAVIEQTVGGMSYDRLKEFVQKHV